MLPEKTLDEGFRKMMKEYLEENLSVIVQLNSDANGNPHRIEVSLVLEGEEIDSNVDWF